MKKPLRILVTLAFLFLLAGCVEINEEIDISESGSGKLTVDMDLSKLIEMIQQYAPKEELEKQFPSQKMDTTIYMKSLVDTSHAIPEEKKKLIRDGNLHVKMDMAAKEFKTNMFFPFTNLDNLQQLYNGMGDGSLGTEKLFKGLTNKNQNASQDTSSGSGFGQFNAIYDFTSKKGLIARKLNPEKWKAFQQSPQLEQFKQSAGMGMEVPYTITIRLPKPVKKIDNPLAKLSEDKKTVTLKYNLMEIFDAPQKFEYSIEY